MKFAVAAVAICLFGCAAGSSAQTAELSSIKRITIDSQVSQPEIPFIQAPGEFKAYLIGGGVGVALDQEQAGKAFRDYMRKNKIDVVRIVLESFTRVIQEDKN